MRRSGGQTARRGRDYVVLAVHRLHATEQVLPLARASERLGFEGLSIPDHLFFPREFHSAYPGSADGRPTWDPEAHWPDPWALASAVGAATTTLRCMSAVYIAPTRDLFTVAKLISTTAVLTNGRVVAGLGAGWWSDEFEQTGQPFAGRGRRPAEMVELLRRLWAGDWVEHRGKAYDFDPLLLAPVPASPIAIVLGGRSEVAMRRAARIADGWIGGTYPASEVPDIVGRMQQLLADAGRDPAGFEISLALVEPLTAELDDLGRRGLSGISIPAWAPAGADAPVEAKIEAVEHFAEQIIRPLQGRPS